MTVGKDFTMRYAIIGLLLCATLILAGCSLAFGGSGEGITGSGNLVSRNFDFTGFETIDAGSNFHVDIQRGEGFAVKVTSDDNFIDNLRVTSSGGKLTLGIKPGNWSLNNVTMRADVTLPALKGVTGRANAVVRFDRFEPASFTLDLSGNAIAEGKVNAGKVEVSADSNGQARLAGATESLEARGKGNAILTLRELAAKQADVDMDGNAMATVQATQSLNYSLRGNAGLTYSGGAQLGKQQTGGNSQAHGQ
jgi:hypothetical protein